MKRYILLIMFFCILLCICSCKSKKYEQGGGVHICKPGTYEPNVPQSMKLNKSIAIGKSAIEREFGKADITHNLDKKSYEVRNMSDGSKLYVIYDNQTSRFIDIWKLEKLLSRKDFDKITEGKSTINDVLKIDPYTIAIEKTDDTCISEHKMVNNEAMDIKYVKKKNVWIVDKVSLIENDPTEFSNIILKEDLP